jgi:hypothetical protein
MLAMQTNAGSSDYTVAGQLMNANAVPTTSSFITPTGLGALAPDIVSIDTTQTAAFIWQATTEADAGDIRMRLISFTTGQLNYPVIPVNQTTVLEQSNPQLARRVKTTNGVMTVWQAQGQVNGSDIVARSFNISPTKQLSAACTAGILSVTPGGQPSITTPRPTPWDSPKVVTRKVRPKESPIEGPYH